MKFVAVFEHIFSNAIVFEAFSENSIEEARRYCDAVVSFNTNYCKDYDLYISDLDHSQEMNKQLNEVYKKIQSFSEGFINGNG